MVHTHKSSHMKILPQSVPLDIFNYLQLSFPVQAKVLKTIPSSFFFLFTKIILFYNGSEFTLKYRKNNLNANAYKPQDENCDILTRPWEWGVWHFFIQTSSKLQEHLLGISSGCPAGPERRRCPLRLVPF